ncbi:50S ribosomal protein L11 [Planctomicrobium sp. SH668]|uniref:50S ribosomal protein L11 n=1 Tax=Planctomicrobium sp. SH668 TaxID=3448126 RepID=UPI003F5BC61D
MGKKKVVNAVIKVQITGGQATPAPPVGTALGPQGVNIGQFVQQFNERTRDMMGTTIPVIITVYNDRSFEFVLKTPPAAVLLKQAAQVAKGASNPRTTKVGVVTQAQVRDIATKKFADMNSSSVEQAMKVIAGTARSMGISIVD